MKKEEKVPAVYILTNKPDGVLYTGVTSDLKARVWQHKQEIIEGFTHKYNIKMLVYYEVLPDMKSAILREKRLKRWRRTWKIELIEKENPDWNDLYDDI